MDGIHSWSGLGCHLGSPVLHCFSQGRHEVNPPPQATGGLFICIHSSWGVARFLKSMWDRKYSAEYFASPGFPYAQRSRSRGEEMASDMGRLATN